MKKHKQLEENLQHAMDLVKSLKEDCDIKENNFIVFFFFFV